MNKNIVAFLIDDDREDQFFFELAVAELRQPVTCCFADDCFKGLEMLAHTDFNPDFIFVDINMPKMNGIECLAKIRKIHRLDGVPVYMYSTSADEFIEERCINLGAAGLIKKETSISAIGEMLLAVFENNKAPH